MHVVTRNAFRPLQIAVAVVAVAFLVVGPLHRVALADSTVGTVQHVSTDNIKVTDTKGDTETFTLVPSFDQVFSADGKTTYEMKNIKAGDTVQISWSHGALGKRADKITVMKHASHSK